MSTYNLPQYIDYKDCLVAFIDILGFDEKVRGIKTEEDFRRVADLLFSIKGVANKYSNEQTLRPNLNITAISDSVILSIPISDPTCVIGLFTLLHRFQYEVLINFKTLMRGYIAKGPVYHKDNIIFGTGYSDAYKKEREIGHAPRIVLAPALVGNAKQLVSNNQNCENDESVFYFLSEDSCDGNYFLDYLKPIGEIKGIPKRQFLAERVGIKALIEENLAKHTGDDKVMRVYNWFNKYYSSTDQYFM